MKHRDPNFIRVLLSEGYAAIDHLEDLLRGKSQSDKYGTPEWFACVERELVAARECHRVLVLLEAG